MSGAANATGGVVQFAGVGFGVGQKLGHGFDFHRRVGHHHVGRGADQGDGYEVFDHVVIELGVNAGIDAMRAGVPDDHGVAVRRRLGGELRAQYAACARFVFDENGLPDFPRKAVCDHAAHGIAAVARGAWHDQADRFRGVVLCAGQRADQCADQGRKDAEFHGVDRFYTVVLKQAWQRHCAKPKHFILTGWGEATAIENPSPGHWEQSMPW